jgi:Holliday junction resolvase
MLKLPKGKKQSRSHTRAPRQERVLRLECKCTKNKSFSVTREMVEKIENAALGAGEVPAILIEFLGPDGKPLHEVAVVPRYVLDSLASSK